MIAKQQKKNITPIRLSPQLKIWLGIALIIMAGLAAYSNNYRGEFILDDYDAIVDNPQITSADSLLDLLLPAPNSPLSGRPVVALTFGVNYMLGGVDVRGYHIVNNIVHVLVALALFGLVRATLLLPAFRERFVADAVVLALAVALLWELHPLNTEAVNYLTQRTEMTMALFYLLTIFCAAAGFNAERKGTWYGAAVFFSAMGMASKEVMVSAPLMVLVYDRYFAAGSFRDALRERKGLYTMLACTWLILGVLQLNDPRAESVRFDGFGERDCTSLDFLRTQLGILVHYLRLAFWPSPLALDYQDVPILRSFTPDLLVPGGLLAALAALTFWGFVRRSWWSFLGVWFFVIIAPSSSIIPMPYEIAAERRMYLPLMAITVCTVFTVYHYGARLLSRRILLVLLAIVLLAAGTATWERNRTYRTAIAIWSDTIEKRPANIRARENLGKALFSEGRVAEAIQQFRTALELQPFTEDAIELYAVLGAALAEQGNFSEAAAMHLQGIALSPELASSYYYLGNTYIRAGELDPAAAAFRKAVELDPRFARAHGNLAMVLLRMGDTAGAEFHLGRLLEIDPGNGRAYAMFADLRTAQGRYEEAEQLLRKALELQPGDQGIRDQLNRLRSVREQ